MKYAEKPKAVKMPKIPSKPAKAPKPAAGSKTGMTPSKKRTRGKC